MAGVQPLVGIVVVNYFGGDRTLRCLESLQHLTWPAERLAAAFGRVGLSDKVRAEAVSLEQFVQLTELLTATPLPATAGMETSK